MFIHCIYTPLLLCDLCEIVEFPYNGNRIIVWISNIDYIYLFRVGIDLISFLYDSLEMNASLLWLIQKPFE